MNIKKHLVGIGDSLYYQSLSHQLSGVKSVLDIACGGDSPLGKVKKTFRSTGVDVFAPSIKKSQKAKIHDQYKIMNILKVDKYFKPETFDAVIALDIVEHLEKKEGLNLINKIEKIAKKKIVVLTPNGFTKQKISENNPYQIHKSGWTPEEFNKLGYKTFGMRGFKFIRGEYATIKYKPWFIWGLISTISGYFVYFFPNLAYEFLAVKEIN